jgi:hypothetical protein
MRRALSFRVSHGLSAQTIAGKLTPRRKSIAERYFSRDDYMARCAKAVDDLVEDRNALRSRVDQQWTDGTR